MIDEIIDSIRKAETQAEEIIHNAQVTGKELISDAHAKAIEIAKKAKDEIKALELRTIAEVERQANDNSAKFIANAAEEARAIIENAEKSIDKAVDLIIGRVKSRYEAN